MNAKIALGAIGGIGLITTVSVVSSRSGSSDPSWEEVMPSFRFLSSDEAFMDITKGNSSSRFGYIYAGLLVGDADINNDWWEWSYENLTKDLKNKGPSLKGTFNVANVSTTELNTPDSLKAWCSEIYKVNVGSQNPFDAPDSIFNNSSVWKYCSPIQQSPVSLQKSKITYPGETLGNTKASVLLDTNKNGRIWYYRNKLFEEAEEDFFNTGESHDIFTKGKEKGRKVQDICADAYDQKLEEDSIHSYVKLFCSISQWLIDS